MNVFNDFRVVLTANVGTKGSWDVLLEECPVAGLAGPKESIQVATIKPQLIRLRDPHNWPNLTELIKIGQSVWKSLMTPTLEAAFVACLVQSQSQNRGMRLVISIVGGESEPAGPEQIRLQELPVEALYSAQYNFLAPSTVTPVSRSLKFKPDRETELISLPLRILVVAATPVDMPEANMLKEKADIQKALQELIQNGSVELEFCEPPTKAELIERLQKKFHIVHFIGHGGFDIVGDDPSPRAHLCLEDENHQSTQLDANTLEVLLRDSDVRMMIMTACSSAAPTPKSEPYQATAFDGVAQRLISGNSKIYAVVAMQFDLESEAAVTFSKVFYKKLLLGLPLDEIVSMCRVSLVSEKGIGHRVWVTPVVYWRCKGGKVFELTGLKGELDEDTLKKIHAIDVQLELFMKYITEVMNKSQEVQKAMASLVASWRQEVNELQQQRGQLLGETLRLFGGQAKPDETIRCRLTLRLRTAWQIGNVRCGVNFPADKVSFSGVSAGASAAGNAPFVQTQMAGKLSLMFQNASQGGRWEADEYELARLDFKVQAGVIDPIITINLTDARVEKDGAVIPLETLNAVLFVTQQE